MAHLMLQNNYLKKSINIKHFSIKFSISLLKSYSRNKLSNKNKKILSQIQLFIDTLPACSSLSVSYITHEFYPYSTKYTPEGNRKKKFFASSYTYINYTCHNPEKDKFLIKYLIPLNFLLNH